MNQKQKRDRFRQQLETIEKGYALQVNALAERFFATLKPVGVAAK
jgi:hypothetical protein